MASDDGIQVWFFNPNATPVIPRAEFLRKWKRVLKESEKENREFSGYDLEMIPTTSMQLIPRLLDLLLSIKCII